MGLVGKTISWAIGWLLVGSHDVLALVPDADDYDESQNLHHTVQALNDQQLSLEAALQIKPSSAGSLGLYDPNTLLGQTGVTPNLVLKELAPHLQQLVPELLERKVRGTVVHEVFQLKYGFWAIAHSNIELHHYANRLVLLRVNLPHIESLAGKYSPSDFKSLSVLQAEVGGPATVYEDSYQILTAQNGELIPAWEIHAVDPSRGAVIRRIIDGRYGNLLEEKATDFRLTSVYSKNPKDGGMIQVKLPDLKSGTNLDGKYFSVFSPDQTDPRAEGNEGDFSYRPDVDGDATHFDEVQTYYNVTRALAFFREKFGFDPKSESITIRVHHNLGGKNDNAYYLPSLATPEIRIGQGDKLKNLSRDVDVISHEYAHHIIYKHLKESKGESGILHEGIADYFAFAISDDPYLGESVLPNSAYLRTATTVDKDKYDLLPASTKTHVKGSYWSSFLWLLRENLGSEYTDLLVYESLPYLGADGTIKDAFLGILSADRDLSGNSRRGEVPLYGENKCAIFAAGLKLGFATYLADFDGSSCGLNLEELAEESRTQIKRLGKSNRTGRTIKPPLKACGTMDFHEKMTQNTSNTTIVLMITPLFFGLWSYIRRASWIWTKS